MAEESFGSISLTYEGFVSHLREIRGHFFAQEGGDRVGAGGLFLGGAAIRSRALHRWNRSRHLRHRWRFWHGGFLVAPEMGGEKGREEARQEWQRRPELREVPSAMR